MLVIFAALFAAIVYRWISLERLQRMAPPEISTTPTPEPTPTAEPQVNDRARTLVPDGVSHAGWFVVVFGVAAFGAAAAWFTRGRRRYVL